MIEVAVVIDRQGKPIHWHLPPGRTGASIPDSPDLWQIIWENRDNILGIAHSHPGMGWPSPSGTDISTFNAIELALGRQLIWWICSENHCVAYTTLEHGEPEFSSDPWLPELRRLSYGSNRQGGSTA